MRAVSPIRQILDFAYLRLRRARRAYGRFKANRKYARIKREILNEPYTPGGAAPPEPSQAQEEAYAQALREAGKAAVYIKMDDRPLPHDADSPRSYFGGLPKLPPSIEWPRWADHEDVFKALTFLGQIDLEELPDTGDPDLPKAGRLLFFIYARFNSLVFQEDPDWVQVIFLPPETPEAPDREPPANLLQFEMNYGYPFFTAADPDWVTERAEDPRVARRYGLRFARMMTWPDDEVFGPDEDWDHYDIYDDTVWDLRDAAVEDVKAQLDAATPSRPARVAPADSRGVSFAAPFIWRDVWLMLDELAQILAPYQGPRGAKYKAQAAIAFDGAARAAIRAVIDGYQDRIEFWRGRAAKHESWTALSAKDRDAFGADFDRLDGLATKLQSDLSPFVWDDLSEMVNGRMTALKSGDELAAPHQEALRDEVRSWLTDWIKRAANHEAQDPIGSPLRDQFKQELSALEARCEANGLALEWRPSAHHPRGAFEVNLLAPSSPYFKREEMIVDGLRTAAELDLDVEALYPGWVIDEVIPERGVTPTESQAKRDLQWMYGPHQMLGYGNKIQNAVVDNKDNVLLFQLHTHGALDWSKSGPTVQVWITRDNLKRRRFHKAFATLESD